MQWVSMQIPPEKIAELTQGMSGRDLSNLTSSLRADCESDQPTQDEISRAIIAFRKLGRTKTDEHLGWDTLILEHATLERLQVICALPKNADDWRAQWVSVPRSLLLIGASGVGKRRAAMTVAHESGLNFLAPTMAQLKAMILGGSANAVRQMFERGRSMAPVIIFLDTLDKLTPKQSPFDSKDRLSEEIASQLQQEMSEVTAADIPVFLIGATQDVDQVDGDVLNCFDERIELAYPDAQSRPDCLPCCSREKNSDSHPEKAPLCCQTDSMAKTSVRAISRAGFREQNNGHWRGRCEAAARSTCASN